MVKIYTENFKKYGKVISSVSEKGQQLYESIYFDFKNSFAYVFSAKCQGRIRFIVENLNNEIIKNFLVPLDKFLLLANLYNYFEVKDRSFYYKDEIFELESFVDDIDVSNFDNLVIDENASNKIVSDSLIMQNLKKAIKYIDDNDERGLNGVFIRDDRLIATNASRLFESKIEDFKSNINLPKTMLKTIVVLDGKEDFFYLGRKENKIYVSISGSVDLLVADDKKLDLPEIDKSEYSHETFINVKREPASEVFQFLDSFTKDIVNNRIYVEVEKDKIFFNVKDKSKIKRELDIITISEELIGLKFWISSSNLKTAFSDFEAKNIKLQIKNDNPAINLVGYDVDTKDEVTYQNKHIVLVQLKE
jgi:hypothetical protein